MGIKKDNVEYVANLARLKFSAVQIKRFTKQIAGIISYVDKLKQVDVKNTLPTSHPLPLKNVFKKDEVKKSLDLEDVLEMAPQKKDNSFKVPKVIEET